MATQSLNNPFADFGSIVYGKRFVGRNKALNIISQRVLGENYGNLAIMGLPRIGKSSLAWQGIMQKKDELLQKNTIPIFLSSGSCNDSNDFFIKLVTCLHDEIQLEFEDNKYVKITQPIIDKIEETDNQSLQSLIMKYYKIVRRLGYKVIYVLDEFDSVQSFFDVAQFQFLRELSYNPETKLCLVTCSRKTIQEIEAKNGAISNFYGTFKDLRLGMFDEEDMRPYWDRVSSYNFSDEYKKNVEFYVGRHPFLLDLFNEYCVRNGIYNLEDNATDIIDEIKLELLNQFNSITSTLNNEKILNSSIQLILGPVYDITKVAEEKLLKYEFIKIVDKEYKMNILGRLVGAQTENGSYICFSDYFTLLFDQTYIANIDYWPLWTSTEKKIRELIKIYIKENFSYDWETEIKANFGNNDKFTDEKWLAKFGTLTETRQKTLKIFHNASSNLIDYTLTRDMYDIFMAKDWSWFGKVFDGAKKDWAKKFNFLADIRNPMAHNNREFIAQEQIQSAIEYCNEIVRTISEWEAKQE